MRLKVEISIDKLPSLYRAGFTTLIKEIMSKTDKVFKDNIQTKYFSYAVKFLEFPETKKESLKIDNDFTIEDNVYYFKNKKVSLFISSSDEIAMNTIRTALIYIDTFDMSKNNELMLQNKKILLELGSPSILKERAFDKSQNIYEFETLSGIVLEDKEKRDKPVDIKDIVEFNRVLNIVSTQTINKVENRELKESLWFEPVEMVTAPEFNTFESFRSGSQRAYMKLTTNKGLFKLKGHHDDIKCLYLNGIGTRNTSGFGLIA